MAFTGNAYCNSFRKELLTATHNFTATTGDVFKLALYSDSAILTAATTDYSTDGEVTGAGYTPGGAALTNITPVVLGTTGIADFADLTFPAVTLTARGALIYNSTAGTNAVLVLDFGRAIAKVAADLVITFPTADASNAIVKVN